MHTPRFLRQDIFSEEDMKNCWNFLRVFEISCFQYWKQFIIFANDMTSKIDEIGSLFLQRRKELGLTQQQVGDRVGVTKSEISKIENGRGITFSTINRLSEALGVTAHIELKPKPEVSLNVIHYIVMSMGMFARQFKLTKKEACNYLLRFKGLEFAVENYEAEHQLSMQDCVDDMAAICLKNGGALTTQTDNNFEFLVEYITAKVVEWMMKDQNIGLEEALVQFHNTETFEKLCDRRTALYIESPAYVYDNFKEEYQRGSLRTLAE